MMQADGFRETSTEFLRPPTETVGLLGLASVEPHFASCHLRAAIPDAGFTVGRASMKGDRRFVAIRGPKIVGQVTTKALLSMLGRKIRGQVD